MVTSKEEILAASRDILQREGWKGLNIRAVASSCGISIGSVYNYYSDKRELEEATVESIWYDIFHPENGITPNTPLLEYVEWLYRRMNYGSEKYPGFFSLHSVSLMNMDIRRSKNKMVKSWSHMQSSLSRIMQADKSISPEVFTESFTRDVFAHTILSLLIAAMLEEKYNPAPTIEIIKRVLY